MTGNPLRPGAAFILATAAVTAAAALIVLDRPDDRRDPQPAPGSPRVGLAPGPGATRRDVPSRPSTAAVNRVARSFALAYCVWDAGRPTRTAAATRRRLASRALWRRLTADRLRPTSVRPNPQLAIEPVRAVRSDDGRWRALVLTRHPAGRYLTTLVLASTEAGVRVVALAR
jgi:hypothetical protein